MVYIQWKHEQSQCKYWDPENPHTVQGFTLHDYKVERMVCSECQQKSQGQCILHKQ